MSSCSKANRDELSLTPSTTVATVGQTISVTLNSNANASSWTVTPSAAASEQFAITTQKINYFTFSSAGQYTIGVRTRDIAYDSTVINHWIYAGEMLADTGVDATAE